MGISKSDKIMYRLGICYFLILLSSSNCARKVRYQKPRAGRQGFEDNQNELFGFLSRITPSGSPNQGIFDFLLDPPPETNTPSYTTPGYFSFLTDPPPQTTPRYTTTTTTTTTTRTTATKKP